MSGILEATVMDCPVCEGERPRRIAELFQGGRFVECTGCGIHFADTAAMDLPAYYQGIWSEGNLGCQPYTEKVEAARDRAGLQRLLKRVPRFRWAVKQLQCLPRGAKVLDVGCGEGALLWAAQELGLEPHGCDLAPAAVELARNLVGSKVHVGTIAELPYEPGTFDCLLGLEVIEHLPNPLPFLERAAALLKPGGLLLLTTPNRYRLFAVLKRLLGKPHSSTDYPPHHYTRWSAEALRRLLGHYFHAVRIGSLAYHFPSPAASTLAVPLHWLMASRMGQSLCAVARCPLPTWRMER